MVQWSCVVYNPQSLKRHGRIRDIARMFRWNDFIALPGTRTPQHSHSSCLVQSVGTHRFYHWGAGKGKHVNESCGVAIGLKKRPFPERCVVNVFSPPTHLQGRGGAIRIKRGDADITPIVAYIPTEPFTQQQREASREIWKWIHDLLSELPARTVPVLLLDANGKTGLHHNQAAGPQGVEHIHDEAIGPCDAAMESYNGSLLHTCLLDHHMFAVNTFYEVGPTWYGWTQANLCSRIDYICLPQSLRASVKSCRILQHSGDALQNMPRPGRCDHRPLQVVFEYQLCFDNVVQNTCWDRDLLQQGLRGGMQRESFAQKVEAACSEFQVNWDDASAHPSKIWTQLQTIVHEAAQSCFQVSRKHTAHSPQDTAEALQQRQASVLAIVSLPRHSVLPFGSCCAGAGSVCLQSLLEVFTVWKLRARFFKTDKQVKHLLQRDRRRWFAARIAEFQQAWERRQFHSLWKTGRMLSGFRLGPKRRRYDIPTKSLPSSREWVQFLSQAGKDGGCHGSECVWGEDQVPCEPRRPSHTDIRLAKDDARNLEKRICHAPLRKAVPHWSCPVEIWRMLLKVDTRVERSGLGFHVGASLCHSFRRVLFQLCLSIRVRSRVPSVWQRSLAAQLDKPNGKTGCAGKRLVHQLDPVGSQFFKHLWSRASPQSYRHYAAGYYTGKSRISAIVQKHVLSHRLDRCHLRHVESFFDVANAFPSPTHDALDRAIHAAAQAVDAPLLCQRHREAVVHIIAPDRSVDVKCNSGALQGDGPAGPIFLEVYHPALDVWLEHVHTLPQQMLFMVSDPVFGVEVDCSVTTYADDVGKTSIVDSCEDMLSILQSLNQWLDEALGAIGLAQNIDKQEHVVHATGPQSRQFLRTAYTEGVGVGKTVSVARYLGCRRSYNNGNQPEIQCRIRAAHNGFAVLGGFWKHAAGSRTATVLVFRCMVHEALLSGLESMVLTPSEIHMLDKTILQLGRKVLRGKACSKIRETQADGSTTVKYVAQPNKFVWQALRLSPCSIELQIRRLSFWQQVARAPFRHVALLATIFGKFPFERHDTLSVSGECTNTANPWAVQICEDIGALSVCDVVAHIPAQMDGKPVRLFTKPLCDEFVQIDCSILRKVFLSVAIPPPGFSEDVDAQDDVDDPPNGAPEELHVCHEVLSSGNICGAGFSTFRALQTHRRTAKNHSFVAPEHYLAVINQCPWCHAKYGTLEHTRRHIKKSLAAQQCRGSGSIVPVPLLPCNSLVCPKCDNVCVSVSDLQQHMVGHFGGPDFSNPWN